MFEYLQFYILLAFGVFEHLFVLPASPWHAVNPWDHSWLVLN